MIGKEKVFLNLAENLKKFMVANKLNATDVAKRTGLSSRTILNIVGAEKAPKITTLDEIAKGLRIQVIDLIKDPGIESSEEYKPTLKDIEHLELMGGLSPAERKDVDRYAQYIIDQRKSRE